MLISGRNQSGLSDREIQHCLEVWRELCGGQERELVTSGASRHSSRTHFNENDGLVYLGADAMPGRAITANSRMSVLACLAHELGHLERFQQGYQRPFDMPDKLLDEAETSIHASFIPVLGPRDREDLIEDASDRLIQWLEQGRRSSEE
jgi:hypothetical protein